VVHFPPPSPEHAGLPFLQGEHFFPPPTVRGESRHLLTIFLGTISALLREGILPRRATSTDPFGLSFSPFLHLKLGVLPWVSASPRRSRGRPRRSLLSFFPRPNRARSPPLARGSRFFRIHQRGSRLRLLLFPPQRSCFPSIFGKGNV